MGKAVSRGQRNVFGMRLGRASTVTNAQREELWRRYQAGETILGIGRALGQRTTNLYRVLQAAGGIAPAQRSRSPRVLSFGEREEISRGIAAGDTFRAIARSLNRAVSTISQEVARHGGRGHYRAAQADWAAWEPARRPKRCLLAMNRDLQRIVAVKLKQDWSPQQIDARTVSNASQYLEHYAGLQVVQYLLGLRTRGLVGRGCSSGPLNGVRR